MVFSLLLGASGCREYGAPNLWISGIFPLPSSLGAHSAIYEFHAGALKTVANMSIHVIGNRSSLHVTWPTVIGGHTGTDIGVMCGSKLERQSKSNIEFLFLVPISELDVAVAVRAFKSSENSLSSARPRWS